MKHPVPLRLFAGFTLLFVVSLPQWALAKSAPIQKETLESGGRKRVCYVYRPDALPGDTRTPVLLLLHGSGHDGTSLVKEWRKLADSAGLLLAGPDALNPQTWTAPEDGPQFLADVVAFLKSRYVVDEKRIYLFGHSAGACFALYVGPLESEFFAAVAVHAGAFRDSADESVLGLASRKIPFFLVVGSRDQFFPVETVRNTKTALQNKGFPVDLLEISGHDHNYYRRAEEINQKVWEFLSPNHLDRDARYKTYSAR
jgi:phospholipase/carboxylesterase